jgi:hypothetical protein
MRSLNTPMSSPSRVTSNSVTRLRLAINRNPFFVERLRGLTPRARSIIHSGRFASLSPIALPGYRSSRHGVLTQHATATYSSGDITITLAVRASTGSLASPPRGNSKKLQASKTFAYTRNHHRAQNLRRVKCPKKVDNKAKKLATGCSRGKIRAHLGAPPEAFGQTWRPDAHERTAPGCGLGGLRSANARRFHALARSANDLDPVPRPRPWGVSPRSIRRRHVARCWLYQASLNQRVGSAHEGDRQAEAVVSSIEVKARLLRRLRP